ncbi:MAG: hypothetical protein DI626_06710 [Micavibrio aeruginosavorus]|uniref:Uncharacterized protein n=1 Tax=Micavibrio aeruginosavorus TaxID=349221 RepID=A0A2W4ZVM3_9BACT|nr:MAG: hypothetical protein DI626_06710 [Micavibrio aeruginosavorus]
MNLSSLNLYSGLAEFLGSGNKANNFDSISQNAFDLAALKATKQTQATPDTTGVNINLSEDAQKLLNQAKSADGKTAVSGVQKIGQNFLLGFFDQLGIDFDGLTNEAINLITGMQDVIADSGATTRDVTTDMAEMRYANNSKKVYTLTGAQSRLRLAIEYATDGTPKKLTLTDIQGARVETADITLASEKGKLTSMEVSRTQREYKNGHMVTLNEIEPMSIKLYPAKAA